jgi:hypothetical protein
MREEVDIMISTLYIYLMCSRADSAALAMALKVVWKPKQLVKITLQVDHL